ncbi:hypothetical protein ABZ874_24650, partial [Streptomyces albidoflavus]|uniref:hypothetical protein n=1 Tax=Streptomyces albidoflavus TaxID=1886 RepID=UPI003403C19A
GFELLATSGTAEVLGRNGIKVARPAIEAIGDRWPRCHLGPVTAWPASEANQARPALEATEPGRRLRPPHPTPTWG